METAGLGMLIDPITAAPPDLLVGTVPYGLKGEEGG